jgi:sulfur-oxidizing protein SoxY
MAFDRREVLAAAGAATFVALMRGGSAMGTEAAGGETAPLTPVPENPVPENDATRSVAPPPPTQQFEAALRSILGDSQPVDARVTVDLPELAENGNIVPYKLDVESPMTAEDHITKLHLLSTLNPQAKVATFNFTLLSGKAAVTGRMRLAKTQDVVAIAETNTGEFLRGTRNIEVIIGGCGSD